MRKGGVLELIILDGGREVQNPTHINLFSEKALRTCLLNAGFSCVKRVFHPVKYKANGFKALALGISQMIGVDGGLRFIAVNGNK